MASPTPSSCETLTTASNSSDSEMESASLSTRCTICNDTYSNPKVLSCFHTFCHPCLEKSRDSDKVSCTECQFDTYLGVDGVSGLKTDYSAINVIETAVIDTSALNCTGCKTKEIDAIARCFDCANFLCANCVMAHQFMHCFEGHRVVSISDLQVSKEEGPKLNKPITCPKHKEDELKFYCKTCVMPICQECITYEHSRGHECHFLMNVVEKEVDMLRHLVGDARTKLGDLQISAKTVGQICTSLQTQYHKAKETINETYAFFQAMVEERKAEATKELDQAFNMKQAGISAVAQKIQDSVDRLCLGVDFIDRLLKHASTTEALMLKNFVEQRFQYIFNFLPDPNQEYFQIEFVSNFQAIQVVINNTFGYVRHGNEAMATQKPQPIARPRSTSLLPNFPSLPGLVGANLFDHDDSDYISRDSSNIGLSFITNDNSQYEKWSSGLDIFSSGIDLFSPSVSSVSDLTPRMVSPSIYPPVSHIRREKMIYHCRFGEFGVLEGQFTEPSGVSVNAQNDIIVADTNNHRIQIFDKEGRFSFQFGECGKHDGQLMYPNRVCVVHTSGDIIVTERSPTHQIQIYTHYGQFVRKFGANVLQHPRGVTVDVKGRIIIVECKVMRVIIFDQFGNVLNTFSCSKHLQFPNSVVVNDKEEIFISDNRSHCVKVFSYQGAFLRQIGGEGITNYPIGVRMSPSGEVIVADNHNNFNLTIFTQEGQLINALESKVKHAQCFDVALMDDGSVVLASKDYKLYVYKYL